MISFTSGGNGTAAITSPRGNVDVPVQHQRHRFARPRFREISIHGHDASHPGLDPRSRVGNEITRPYPPAGHCPGIAAIAVIRAVDHLHRHAECAIEWAHQRLRRFQRGEQARSGIPIHALAGRNDIVAIPRADRDRGNLHISQLGAQIPKIQHKAVEYRLVEIDEVHLVHSQHNLADAH